MFRSIWRPLVCAAAVVLRRTLRRGWPNRRTRRCRCRRSSSSRAPCRRLRSPRRSGQGEEVLAAGGGRSRAAAPATASQPQQPESPERARGASPCRTRPRRGPRSTARRAASMWFRTRAYKASTPAVTDQGRARLRAGRVRAAEVGRRHAAVDPRLGPVAQLPSARPAALHGRHPDQHRRRLRRLPGDRPDRLPLRRGLQGRQRAALRRQLARRRHQLRDADRL